MSFQITISPNRRVAARFIAHVRRTLQKSLVIEQERNGITQAEIARKLGVHRSVISRELTGRKDITLGRVAELAWALGREIYFDIPESRTNPQSNLQINPGYVRNNIGFTSSTSASLCNQRFETVSVI